MDTFNIIEVTERKPLRPEFAEKVKYKVTKEVRIKLFGKEIKLPSTVLKDNLDTQEEADAEIEYQRLLKEDLTKEIIIKKIQF